MKSKIIVAALLLSSTFAIADSNVCSKAPRTVIYDNKPVDVHVNQSGWTRLVFPETHLIGLDPEVKEGIIVHELDAQLANRRVIRPNKPNYNSLMFVYGASGKEIVLNLISSDCSDSQVTIESFQASEETIEIKRKLDARPTKTLNSYMYQYLMSSKSMPLPDGFRKEVLNGNGDQLVMQIGSVKIFAEETWRGTTKDAIFLRVENHGRMAQKIDISQVDFGDNAIIKVFGRVDTIAMIPISRVLAPAPQFTTDLYDNQPSVGYLLIASEK